MPRLQANSTPPSSGLSKCHKLGQQKKLSSQWEEIDTAVSQSEMEHVSDELSNIRNPVSMTHSDWSDNTPPRRAVVAGGVSSHDYYTPSPFGGGKRDEERRRVWRRAPPGDHITVTDGDGVRVYLRLRPSTRLSDEVVLNTRSDALNYFHAL